MFQVSFIIILTKIKIIINETWNINTIDIFIHTNNINLYEKILNNYTMGILK